jgi:hypothetical protein
MKSVVLDYGDDYYFADELQMADPNGVRAVRLKPGSERMIGKLLHFDVMITPYTSVRKEGKKVIHSGKGPEFIQKDWKLALPNEFKDKPIKDLRAEDFSLRLGTPLSSSIDYHIKWVYDPK